MNKEQKEIEKFLKNKTFFCDKFKARISENQCLLNCARSVYHMKVYNRRSANPAYKNDREIFYTKLCLGNITCYGCNKFKKPNKTIQKIIDGILKKESFYDRTPIDMYDHISASSTL